MGSASVSRLTPTMFSGDHFDQEPRTGYGKTITHGMTKFCTFGNVMQNCPVYLNHVHSLQYQFWEVSQIAVY